MWSKTKVTELLHIKYPIIQGPFGGSFSSAKLVSSVSNLGGMGSFGLNSYSPSKILAINTEIKSLTQKPYALNLWVPLKNNLEKPFSKKDFEYLKVTFKPYFDLLDLTIPDLPELPKGQDFEEQVEAVLKSKPPVVSFIFGVPSKNIVSELKQRKIIIMATATTLEEAKLLEEAKIDIVIASGKEAGGHRASFIKPPEESIYKTHTLVSQLLNKIKIPIIAAGGITTGNDIYKFLNVGASAVQLGTVFLATKESNASTLHKKQLLSKNLLDTNLTKVYTGRLARVITTHFSKEFNKKKLAPYPIQSSFLSSLRKKALEKSQLDYVAFWAGQPTTVLKYKSTNELFSALLKEISMLAV